MSYNNQGFFYNFRQTVYKWWCVVYKPAYKLFHHGYWPTEKDPYYQTPASISNEVASTEAHPSATANNPNMPSDPQAENLANQILGSKQGNVDAMVANTTSTELSDTTDMKAAEPELDLSGVDPDALAKANEIMARLAAEAAADEAKKQSEIDAAKAKAAETDRLNAILNSTKVDISAFIEEGKAQRDKNQG